MKNKKGSYTIEASLLMGIILSVIIGLIYLGFYLHDTVFLQGAAYEAVCSMLLQGADGEKNASKTAEALTGNRMMQTKNLQYNIQEGEDKVCVDISGVFPIPKLAEQLYGSDVLKAQGRVMLTGKRPSDKIQKIRQTVKLINHIRGS